ncbi:hypothetical protein BU25DRAFT_212449 [Macroventuria anomochaeta]|uniref:Uncharacterized protein n=1 Tax=Macroventuria anomochaeta TaxID=301207 RepID=A0ACB6RKU0_9PLEO|nr:uncharacterized protein BU25DRAFT_212449 [Macroventuria anomochaeta]KAF2622413.1 hypothetical protein BU25DRAFT_212449 [Macroventuria anomochaeta]
MRCPSTAVVLTVVSALICSQHCLCLKLYTIKCPAFLVSQDVYSSACIPSLQISLSSEAFCVLFSLSHRDFRFFLARLGSACLHCDSQFRLPYKALTTSSLLDDRPLAIPPHRICSNRIRHVPF